MGWGIAIVAAALFVAWALLNLKTSRKDGTYLGRIHPYRRLMPYIMQTRNESVVYFDHFVDATQLVDYVRQTKEKFGGDMTHCVVAACAVGLSRVPSLNQFVMGRRLYQRRGNHIAFSMKRKRLDKKAKLAVVKLEIPQTESFRDFCERVTAKIGVERSGDRTYADKEYDLFNMVPRPVLNGAVALFRWLDYHNVLPHSFIENDGMYCSLFVANLGSLGMGPGYHHLYEWGNCSTFCMVGALEDRPTVIDGEIVIQPTLHIRWSFDERIDDGLGARFGMEAVTHVLTNPFEELGCLADDDSDRRVLGAREGEE
jgi:hypothetical protein